MKPKENRYRKIIEQIFFQNFKTGNTKVAFTRDEISMVAKKLKIRLAKNPGDVVYTFRYRASLPQSIISMAPKGTEWIIRPIGQAQYSFEAVPITAIGPSKHLAETKIPNATPGIITQYALSDEQALLAILRYNRLIDIFTGVTCYSLQSHLRTNVPQMGQIETDEVYVGLDRRGAHYVFPVQAKGGKDRLGVVQIEQDIALCSLKFPDLICRPIAAQFLDDDVIALFELERTKTSIKVSLEKHYRLVQPNEMTAEDLESYRKRSE